MNQKSFNFFLDLDTKVKELKTVEIKVPENATNIEEV